MEELEAKRDTAPDVDNVDQLAIELRRRQSQDIGLEIIRRFFAEQAINSQAGQQRHGRLRSS